MSWNYMSKEAMTYYDSTGRAANWSNSMFSGLPTIMYYQPSNSNWFGSLSGKLQMQPANGSINPMVYFFIAMLSFFVLLKTLKVNTLISTIGAIAFAFTSYNAIIIAAGHMTKLIDLIFVPGVIAGILQVYRRRYALGALMTAVFLSFMIAAWHVQIIYYSAILFAAICIAFLVIAIKKGTINQYVKGTVIILITSIIAALPSFSGLRGTVGYSKNSTRGGTSELTINKTQHAEQTNGGLSKEYAFQWSNGIGETFCMLIPNLYGGQSGENIGPDSKFGEALTSIGVPEYQVEQMTARAPTYWGPQPFLSGPIYFGAIVCFLFVLSLLVIKSPLKWWLTGAGLLFAMLSWGKNFELLNYFLFDHLPFYNKFRTPTMALALTSIIFPMLGFWGLYYFMSGQYTKEVLLAKLKKAVFITGGITLAVILYSQFLMDFKGAGDAQMAQSYGEHANTLLKALRDDRQSMALKDGLRSLAFILVAAAALWAFAKEMVKKEIAIVALGLACIIDLWSVSHRYLTDDTYIDATTLEQEYFTPRPVDLEILKDKDPNYRVLDLSVNTFNDAKPSYFHKTIGGYHPAKLQIYQDLIETQISKLNGAVLDMLNTKYIITAGQKQGEAQAIPNPKALGNAWFISNIKYTKTADETVLSMNAPAINDPKQDSAQQAFKPAETAIIRDNNRTAIGKDAFVKDSTSRIVMTQYDLPELHYESNNNNDGFAVFSEIYYPENWKAYIDGKETPIYCVNYVLRGIKVPAGKHKIDFKYNDPVIKAGEQINTIGSILLTLLIVGTLVILFIQNKKGEVKQAEEADELR
ncbi:YfhO family protein [Taibaiella sp. KBW10]|uniref:YfhO family protein n=1 Tax=Taibaiella sp. KBW10 TaxID=2153357 RepID=UPI001315386A|nr:YfhO family protein [Taibaiella sp. KBW10]